MLDAGWIPAPELGTSVGTILEVSQGLVSINMRYSKLIPFNSNFCHFHIYQIYIYVYVTHIYTCTNIHAPFSCVWFAVPATPSIQWMDVFGSLCQYKLKLTFCWKVMCLTALDLLYIFSFVKATEGKELRLTCVFRHVNSVPSHCQKNDIPSTI